MNNEWHIVNPIVQDYTVEPLYCGHHWDRPMWHHWDRPMRVLIREVSLFQSVLIREVPLYIFICACVCVCSCLVPFLQVNSSLSSGSSSTITYLLERVVDQITASPLSSVTVCHTMSVCLLYTIIYSFVCIAKRWLGGKLQEHNATNRCN